MGASRSEAMRVDGTRRGGVRQAGETRRDGANKRDAQFAQGAAKFSDIQAKRTKIAPYLA